RTSGASIAIASPLRAAAAAANRSSSSGLMQKVGSDVPASFPALVVIQVPEAADLRPVAVAAAAAEGLGHFIFSAIVIEGNLCAAGDGRQRDQPSTVHPGVGAAGMVQKPP